jgi:hypothetical protein
MLKNLFLIGCLVFSAVAFSQIDNTNNSVRFDAPDSNLDDPSGFGLPPVKMPTLSKTDNPNTPDNSDLGKEKEKQIDMKNGDGLLEYSTNKTPKYFTKDKEEKPEYGKDQYLGDLTTKAKRVTFMYRDHEYVDGDRIRIFVNGDIVVSSVMLEGNFQGFDLPLKDGFNKVDFQALNQGSSGPNTAQLQVFDEVGNLLASYEWNLLTGNKATAIVVKQ